ncbi:MAG: proline dehydrogenase family protein, partial [Pirellulales bacterium]|nr:proline dehydrogenase family protein [Pirellulales bacterium]
KKYNIGKEACIYNTVQLYRWDRINYLKKLIKDRGDFRLGFKLVRGAYMEKERQLATDNDYQSPICKSKEETDNYFNKALRFLFSNIEGVDIFVASHNEESNYLVLEMMGKYSLKNDSNNIWFCQLYGMGDNITFNLSQKGYNVAKILPFGPVKNLIPYLIRSAQNSPRTAPQRVIFNPQHAKVVIFACAPALFVISSQRVRVFSKWELELGSPNISPNPVQINPAP